MKEKIKDLAIEFGHFETIARGSYNDVNPAEVRQNLDELTMVNAYLQGKRFKNFTEIGCAEGGSLWVYANMLGIKNIRAIEINPHGFLRYTCNKLKKMGVDIELIEKDSMKVVDEIKDNSIDLLHIDGNHTEEAARRDWDLYYPKVKKGGIIILHDTIGHEGTKILRENLEKEYDVITFYAEEKPCGTSIIKK